MDRPPYFAFYPADFANDLNVEAMTTLQVGAYVLLLCKAWQADPPASLPTDDNVLARYARVDVGVWAEIKPGVLGAFRLGSDGRWHNKRLRLEYDKALQLIKAKKKAGEKGAEARWGKRPADGTPNGSAIAEALGGHCDGNANQSQKLSVPSELSGAPPPARGSHKPKKPRAEPTGPHADACRGFCERWCAKYGEEYAFDFGKHGKHLSWMLEKVGDDVPRLFGIFDRFLADADEFYAAGSRHDLAKLKQNFTRWQASGTPPPAAPATPSPVAPATGPNPRTQAIIDARKKQEAGNETHG